MHNKKNIFHSKTEGCNPNQDALHQLLRHQQTIFGLRTGHCSLNSHLKRIGVKTSAQCPFRQADQNTRTLAAILLTLPASKAADMAHLCVPQNQALVVFNRFVPEYPSMWHSRERGLLHNHHIERRRRRVKTELTAKLPRSLTSSVACSIDSY